MVLLFPFSCSRLKTRRLAREGDMDYYCTPYKLIVLSAHSDRLLARMASTIREASWSTG